MDKKAMSEKENKQTKDPLKAVKGILKKEYPDLPKEDIDRLAKTCTGKPWFLELKRERLSKDLDENNYKKVVVAANAGGVEKDDTPAASEEKYGEQIDPRLKRSGERIEDPDPESLMAGRERDIKAAEWTVHLLLSARTDRVRHMRASVCLQILRNNLNLTEIAEHFDVTPQRVTQVVNEVKTFEISER
jgi:hypothetical protein